MPDGPKPSGIFLFARQLLFVIAGAAACLYIMKGLPTHAWERFGIWLVVGLLVYVLYGYRHSKLAGHPQ